MFSKFLVAFGIAAASTAIAAPASAAQTWLDIHELGDSDSFSHTNGFYKGFTDIYVFKTPGPGLISGTISSLATLPKLDVYLKAVTFDGTLATRVSTGLLDAWTLDDISVDAGKHYLSIAGYWGKSGGSYSGTLSYSAPVPEPAAWAMMIAGFGLVGAAMRRRQKVKVSYA